MKIENQTVPIEQISPYKYRIPRDYKEGMRTDGIVYASPALMETIRADQAIEQVANVACLPGIVGNSMAMPDIHWGYGFPIGGVAATDAEHGVISPGGVGYDINCGVRLLRTNLVFDEIKEKIPKLMDALFVNVPSGVGSKGKIRITKNELDDLLVKGPAWAVKRGYGRQEDLTHTEERGCMKGADPEKVSSKAKERGAPQLGTLGSGNHFLEVQIVEEIFDEKTAGVLDIHKEQALVMIHTGSRGFGYQVCDDYLKVMDSAAKKYNILLPDRQLACAPLNSDEGRDYFGAMACAANFAWANRQCIAHWVRETFSLILRQGEEKLGMDLMYDVAHNIAKFEEHEVGGVRKRVCVHRKGATRAFAPGSNDIPQDYKNIGQPVFVPGDMGRYSYLLVGTQQAMKETFGSTCHGAGRVMSRNKAKKSISDSELVEQLAKKGISVRSASRSVLAEEAPHAYKDVAEVVKVCEGAGLAKIVARMRPVGVTKG